MSGSLSDDALTQGGFAATIRQADHELAEARLRFPGDRLRSPEGWTEHGWMEEQPSLPIDRNEFQKVMGDVGRVLPKTAFISLDAGDQHRIGPRLDVLGYEVRLHEVKPSGPGQSFALRLGADGNPTTPLLIAASHVPVADEKDLERLHAAEAEGNGQPEGGAAKVADVLAFGQLARLAEDERGGGLTHDMLAALKADADCLGMVLGYGLGDAVSFGRYASVARTVDQFFKGFLTEQLKRGYRHVYTVFAGGDDLFLIGPWYDLAKLLADLHDWFCRVTCDSPNTTFSAGLVFSHARTPARHLASLGDESLKQAKEAGRDRVTDRLRPSASERLDKEGVAQPAFEELP